MNGNGNFKIRRILVLCPNLEEQGGVAHYYSLVKKYFSSESIDLNFFHIGRTSTESRSGRIPRSLKDLLNFAMSVPKYDLVVLNPSLDPKSLVRDGVCHILAKRIFRKKTLVFFRGWIPKYEKLIDRHGRTLFRGVFNSDKIMVLCSQFRDTLATWGIPIEKITLETTTYEHYDFSMQKKISNLLFLSRFVQDKGCLEAIRTVELLAHEFPEVKLHMVGDGILKPDLIRYVKDHGLGEHVEFAGWLEGERKSRLLGQCGIMLYPTDYGEGMPNSILEGMGMGLAIVSRPVAGIPDVVIDGENGFLVPSLDPRDFALKIKFLLLNQDIWEKISDTNRRIAMERFAITSVVIRLERHYSNLLR